MLKLEKIWIDTVGGRTALRIGWDNDRHQSIVLESLTPDDVKKGLLDAAHLIAQEQRHGHL